MIAFGRESDRPEHELRTDYSNSPFKTYVDCTLWYMKGYKKLDLLGFSNGDRISLRTEAPAAGKSMAVIGGRARDEARNSTKENLKVLPSWVPTWTFMNGKRQILNSLSKMSDVGISKRNHVYRACGRHHHVTCHFENGSKRLVVHLSVPVVRVSTIDPIQGLEKLVDRKQRKRETNLGLDKIWETIDKESQCPLTGRDMKSVLDRTTRADVHVWFNKEGVMKFSRIDESNLDDEEAARSHPLLGRSGYRPAVDPSGDLAVYWMSTGRTLFLTESTPDGSPGLIGLGPWNAKAGDEVWLLQGFRVLAILRPLQITEDCTYGSMDLETGDAKDKFLPAGETVYEYVGEAFILGLMDGEIIDMLGSPPKRPRPPTLVQMDKDFRKIGLV
ncbi:uncharacterized protein Z518_09110 [Rhinocladiella mackenziei CBS 650.93]|uniref:Rhinocladiella mackenziei CBS 650.93 unplaced genomic scaffold supercont1.7, whole genome shotgun sequence n=1 Tax=Rhinocladiella mackenziei CBS 650.93 TaxID=1442369 RepID=A0A0D2IXS9_9EURO|nr:uncharacterized protein Z518_09110 [Rhinocladiella mackenziei CBS 650.93]KIX01385.1 hypothetical protein Z518_09110 [Rhinocladiella mackenziei CBS 650.93]